MALAPLPSVSVEPGERLKDPILEARARDISKGLRCLVCQNQSIDDSDASLARDLRVLVRERLVGGAAVIVFLRRRTRLAGDGVTPLNDKERRHIERLLDDGAGH